MSFNNTADDWVKHLINMLFVSRCKVFIEEEILRIYEVECMDSYNENNNNGTTDIRSKKKKRIKPNSVKELGLKVEILSLSDMLVETPNRTMINKILWNVLPNLMNVVPKINDEDDQEEVNNVSTPGIDWNEIGLLPDLFHINRNTNVADEITMNVSVDGVDEERAKMTTVMQTMTVIQTQMVIQMKTMWIKMKRRYYPT